MKSAPRRTLCSACFLALAALVLTPSDAACQQVSKEYLQGTQAFRYILHYRDFVPLGDLRDIADAAQKTILVVFGDTRILEENSSGVRKFVDEGGALFVATDHTVPQQRNRGTTWAGLFSIEFIGQPVVAPPDSCYQQIDECPIVRPVEQNVVSLFADLDFGVATNRAGMLHRPPRSLLSRGRDFLFPQLATLAVFPPGSSHDGRGFNPADYPFAVGGPWGKGCVLFLADHSVFINNMMLQSDTGNVGFTVNCLDWLRSTGPERRDRVLFYDEGRVVTNFDVPVKFRPPGLPPVNDMITMMNQAIAGLERENVHNEFLKPYYESLRKWLAIGLTVLLAAYIYLRLIRSPRRLDTGGPLLAPTLARLAPLGAGMAQRHSAILAGGNLWEPARALARGFFETALGTHETTAGTSPPPFQSTESWLGRRFVDRLVQHLWRLAYGAVPERIAPATFAHLAAQVDELKAALADGSLRFLKPSTS